MNWLSFFFLPGSLSGEMGKELIIPSGAETHDGAKLSRDFFINCGVKKIMQLIKAKLWQQTATLLYDSKILI